MRRALILSVSLVAVMCADSSAQVRTLKPIMREKLANTQQLLEGVVRGDFVLMNRFGDRLGEITFTEVASWQNSGLPEYLRHARSFLTAVDAFRTAVAATDHERAASAYSDIVASCTQCHVYVRVSRRASMPLPSRR